MINDLLTRGLNKSITIGLMFYLWFTFGCTKENLVPTAFLNIYPDAGLTTTIFDIDASQSSDEDCIPQLLEFRWDYNGDGQWDTQFNKGAISAYKYKNPGDYSVIVEVKDPHGASSIAQTSIVVSTYKSFIDERNGVEYPMVLFGDTWWMGANLDYGKIIPPDQDQENNGIVEKYQYTSNDNQKFAGGLYQWEEAMDYNETQGSRGVCPQGWHLPTDQDWKNLLSHFSDPVGKRIPDYQIENVKYLPDQMVHHDNYGADGSIWKLLKATGRTGFDVIPQGYRNPDGGFDTKDYHFSGETATFWTSSKHENYAIRCRFYVDGTKGEIFRFWDNPDYGFSIRCIKNND